jgi:hypothetical protein
MGVFIGLDVSLSKTAVCVIDRDGAVLWQGKVPSEPDPLITRLAEWSGPIDLAGIERARCQNGCTAGCAKPASPSASVSRNLLGAGQSLSPTRRPARILLTAQSYRRPRTAGRR